MLHKTMQTEKFQATLKVLLALMKQIFLTPFA